jgi:putative N-acetylmannosamine-6-phosphate epimerase
MDMGSWAVVVGSAITRPLEITKKFMAALED